MRRAGALVLLALASCVNVSPAFHCNTGDDAACVTSAGIHGRCELSGNCSFPDTSCGAPGFRYDQSADPGRGGVCVLASNAFSATAPQPVDGSHPLMLEITTAPQGIVFDTDASGTDTPVTFHWFAGPCPPTPAGEGASMPETCSAPNPTVRRVAVMPSDPGAYCLVGAPEGGSSGHVAVRVFPSNAGTAPACD